MDFPGRYGLGVALLGSDTPQEVVRAATAAEQAGLTSLWMAEDRFFGGAFALAGAALAVTQRLAVGIGVVNPYTRHPAILAMESASLAGIAPGRIVLGLGGSRRSWIEEQIGISHQAPLATVRECVEIVRALWRGDTVKWSGRQFRVPNARLQVTRTQPDLPIVLGFKAQKGVALAGEIADGAHCSNGSSPEHIRRVCATTQAARAKAGRSADFSVSSYLTFSVSKNGDEARQRVKPLVAHILGILHGQSSLRDAGFTDHDTRPFREAQQAGVPAASMVPDEYVARLAVAGTPDECRRALKRWADAGLETPVAILTPGVDRLEQIEMLGAELAPFWQEVVRRRQAS